VPPIPDGLRGIGVVEQWVDPQRDSLPRVIANVRAGDDARRRYAGDTPTIFAWRREAEHRLDVAREAWEAEHVATVATSGEVILSLDRPAPAVVLSAVAIDIRERRRWQFGAQCEFRDKDAFQDTYGYRQSHRPEPT
jgi:hypothetical protein